MAAQMDPGKSFEDQFSKLHPGFPVNTRIAIVGGGPSGLSAAYALCKLGYNNVTVLEKHHTVSGMCLSVDIEGKIYDLGGQVLAASSSPTIFHLAKETGSDLEEMDSHKLALIDSFTGKYQDIKVADDYVSAISLTLELQDKAKKSGRIGVHAISDFASDSTPAFLEDHGFKSVPKSVAYGYTASGYGFVQDMPYAYIHEFTRTSMAGKIRRFKGGYMSMWQKISESLPIKVLCNTEVVAIRRNSSGVNFKIKQNDGNLTSLEFDKVIISGSFPFKNGRTYRSPSQMPEDAENEILDFSELENELFRKVQTIDYYTTVMKIKGLEHMPVGFFYFGEFMDDPATIGNPVAMQKFYSDSNIFLFWSYGNSANIKGPEVTQLAIDAVKRMGGEIEMVNLQQRFKYFPHVESKDMKGGFYEKLETELQGQQNTYYIGGLMAFELTERNSSYSMGLVCKHFATDDLVPRFPYVKRLFTLKAECRDKIPRELDESKGQEFPNLSSLDGYLKYWGNHNISCNKILYRWINDEGEVMGQRTFGELHANAACIAEKLLSSRKPVINPGDRVLLVHVPGLDFIDAFFGCLRARVLPVPVLPPDPLQRGGQALLKIENIAKSCKAVAILSTVGYQLAVRAGSVKNLISLSNKNGKSLGRWPNLPWLHTDSWVKNSKDMPSVSIDCDSMPHADELCFLQFTSGSTGDAKGVVITHGGLIHNVKLMQRRYRSTSNTVLVSWLPQYHDMGLIGGLFTALVSGATAVLFSPMTFIKNPLLWLETISKYRGTHSAGPNFSFELVVRRLEVDKNKIRNYDLSSMIFLMIAAEPVRQKTLKRFIELTIPYGLSQYVMAPGYGLAENCVFVCCAYGEGKPIVVDWQGRVCCGYVNPNDSDVDIRIVDPETCEEQIESGKEGEIWIGSPSAGIGYWGREELSESTFRNKLENHPGKRYTRTGDLGRTINKNLFITGRIKDLIIVAGKNIYSADVEKTVESSCELLRPGCCAVIGVPEDILSTKGIPVPDTSDQVGLVVIAEIRDDKPVSKDDVEKIKAKVAEEHGVNLTAVTLIKPRTISKTTSGKIKRFECLKQFTDGTLNLVPEPKIPKRLLLRSNTTGTCRDGHTPRPQLKTSLLSPGTKLDIREIVEYLKGLISEQTGISVSKISTTANLASYGIDSIGVVRAAQKLSDYLGVPVGAVDIFTATSIEDLASFSEDLVAKSQPQHTKNSASLPEPEVNSSELLTEVSLSHQLGIMSLQFLALIYVSILLILPAYLSISVFLKMISAAHSLINGIPWAPYVLSLAFAPLAWILCIFATCSCIALFGNSFLQPNYALIPEISIWSLDFIKWWTLYKAQEVSSKVLAVHLRGTVLLKYWFQMFGAKIGSSVVLDTVDITDPALVHIGEGVVIAEGVLIQSHEMRNGILSFRPIRIGKSCSIAPYAVIQKGTVLGEGTQVPALQITEEGNPASKSKANNIQKVMELSKVTDDTRYQAIHHLMGIYIVGFISSLSAAIFYFIYILLAQKPPTIEHFAFLCVFGAFHWFPYTIFAYATMIGSTSLSPLSFSISVATAYLAHGLILSLITCLMNHSMSGNQGTKTTYLRMWLRHRITISCHLRFTKLLSGTEAFCIYLRLLGAKVGKYCSIRAINPVLEPKLVSIGNGVHLGDFSRIITGFYSSDGFTSGKVAVQDNVVLGSQSLILPGSIIQEDVIIGALSVAPVNAVLQRGGVYIGSQSPIMIKNTMHELDERIEEMDPKYKKIVGNLAANLAATTLKVRTRYFHRIGVSGKGVLKLYDNIEGFPDHNIFQPGKSYPVIVRHSNSLSADDDARIDARGAALRILSHKSDRESPLLDMTLKTGKAFYARTISDFATWLVCGLPAREEQVKGAPHIRDAVWMSLRHANSFAELHYYSNICRLFRFTNGQEMYVKFKLRPSDVTISEDSGKVEPIGILPPETGAIPRDSNDTRPLLFLAKDFQTRVSSPGGVRYVFQLQFRPVPHDKATQDVALDCTKPWDDSEFPCVDIGEITINQNLTKEQSEELEFNPFLRCHEVDVIRATSASQSASIDHGRSLIYEICQHLRNNEPLPQAWRAFIEQSDVKVDLSSCPVAAMLQRGNSSEVTLARTWFQTSWAIFMQPLLQTFLPYFLMAYVICGPLNWILFAKETMKYPLQWLLPFFWVFSGMWAALACVIAKWILVGKKKDGGTALIWSKSIFMDTIWQAFKTLAGDYFMDMTGGSIFFVLWMKLMGSDINLGEGVYVDSMGAVLNPEMVEIERGGCVGREALLFGHIYEGEGGKVKFGKVRVGEGGFVGSRAVAMPGVIVEDGGSLNALSLAMKEEVVRSKSHN
ncbi:4-coumarate--CoA ligase [Abeliophyllum distichum]|uniref:4-coumarate--CoA ligase n=1 Tax=Abeliophyllum distichum TaxID=126358 RepID=A0ABD1RC68_9LAMI